MSIQETPEYQELKKRHDAEYQALVSKHHSKQQLHRLATKQTNQLIRFVKRWAKAEVKKEDSR